MSKDEWYSKLNLWAHEDSRLERMPLVYLRALAEHIANAQAVEHSVHLTECPVRTLGDACPQCGGCEWQCAECNGALGQVTQAVGRILAKKEKTMSVSKIAILIERYKIGASVDEYKTFFHPAQEELKALQYVQHSAQRIAFSAFTAGVLVGVVVSLIIVFIQIGVR